jgi:hypothetical protein
MHQAKEGLMKTKTSPPLPRWALGLWLAFWVITAVLYLANPGNQSGWMYWTAIALTGVWLGAGGYAFADQPRRQREYDEERAIALRNIQKENGR